MSIKNSLKRLLLFVIGMSVVVGSSYYLFISFPTTQLELIGVILVVVSAGIGTIITKKLSASVFPEHNVGRISIDGNIVEAESSDLSPIGGGSTSSETVVDQVREADENDHIDGLIVKINTGGGGIVPSENIRRVLEEFDGPTIAYATEVCASGGYWVASGCDEIWAHQGSLIGSIGVKYSQIRFKDFTEKLGISYESITSGEYKEILTKFKQLEPHERAQLQNISDTYYDVFIERLSESRDLDRQDFESTEAKVYVGQDAKENGLVDELGYESEVREQMEARLNQDVVITELSESGVITQIAGGARSIVYSFGTGLGSSLVSSENGGFEF